MDSAPTARASWLRGETLVAVPGYFMTIEEGEREKMRAKERKSEEGEWGRAWRKEREKKAVKRIVKIEMDIRRRSRD